jgi:hypothetical protein
MVMKLYLKASATKGVFVCDVVIVALVLVDD